MGKLVSFSSSEAGVLEELVSVQNGDFILADVAVARLRPRVISPPGLRAQDTFCAPNLFKASRRKMSITLWRPTRL